MSNHHIIGSSNNPATTLGDVIFASGLNMHPDARAEAERRLHWIECERETWGVENKDA
jgi:hypothetical protein